MQRLEVSGAVRLIYRSLGLKGLSTLYFIIPPGGGGKHITAQIHPPLAPQLHPHEGGDPVADIVF